MTNNIDVFIKHRQPYTNMKLAKRDVKRIGGGIANDCYNNAVKARDRKHGVAIASGWLIEPYCSVNNSFEITAHFWNATMTGEFFDTTPIQNPNVEYVSDGAIMAYILSNHEMLSSHVPSSILFKNNAFLCVDENVDGSLSFTPILELTTEILFHRKIISN